MKNSKWQILGVIAYLTILALFVYLLIKGWSFKPEILFWIYLPAAVANMSPVLLKGLMGSLVACPIDAGWKIGGKRLFGEHKTWGGLVAGTIGGVLGLFLVILIVERLTGLFSWNLGSVMGLVVLGCFVGFSALLGDLIKSFLKRRIGIEEGGVWWFFDQNDFVIGAFLGVRLFFYINNNPMEIWDQLPIYLILNPLLHLTSNIIAYKLKLKKVWW